MRWPIKNPIIRFISGVFGMGYYGMIVGVCAGMILYHHYSQNLPDYQQLANYTPDIVTRLYTKDDQLLAEYATEKRIFVPIEAVPRKLIQAFIATEDQDFYHHKGVDIRGIGRALVENVRNYMHSTNGRYALEGGSTITQQVVKNFLLSNEQSIERKVKEAILALRISQVYSKDEILELYLNEIYFGRGVWGIAAASLSYFNKPLNELKTEEIALLAALPKAPSTYNPDRNYDAALVRRNTVLSLMEEEGYINTAEAEYARNEPLTLYVQDKQEVIHADFFAEEVRRTLANLYGSDALYKGGLTVYTTLNPAMQKQADEALRFALLEYDRRHGYRGPIRHLDLIENWEESLPTIKEEAALSLYKGEDMAVVLGVDANKASIGLSGGTEAVIKLDGVKWARKKGKKGLGPEIKQVADALSKGDVILVSALKNAGEYGLHQIPEVNGAMVVLDPHTGRVLALSGGYSYNKSEFNRATQALRQPGSAFKPFAYLAALENGFSPSTIIMDAPIEIPQGPNKPLWKPQNYGGSYLGPTTIRVGLEKSRNAMTVRLAQMLGLSRIIRVAKRFGIYETLPRNFSMVLGAQETTLLKLVNAYGMIVNGGKRITPSLIERIDNRNGKVIYHRDQRACEGCDVYGDRPMYDALPPLPQDNRERVVDERVAYQVTSLMEGVVQFGTATKAKILDMPLGGKTGTTNDSRDAWFIGFSPDLVAGVYIGFDKPRSLGGKETGGQVALPAFIHFMETAMKDIPKRPFPVPSGIQRIQVDHATGLPAYPGEGGDGKTVLEAFLTDGNIYQPPLPPGEEEAIDPPVSLASQPGDRWQQDYEYEEGYDDGHRWQPTYHNQNTMPWASQTPSRYGRQDLLYARPERYRLQPANPYEQRRRDARTRPNFSSRRSPDTGTGGLY